MRHCPACDRHLPRSAFDGGAKNCRECAATAALRPRRRRFPDLEARRRQLEAETGVPHAIDHVIPFASRTRETHEVPSLLVCGLDDPRNLQIIPAGQNSTKRWRFTRAEAAAEEARLLAHARKVHAGV